MAMEVGNPVPFKRRTTVPPSVLIPSKFDLIPTLLKPRKSPSFCNGPYYHRLPLSSPPSFTCSSPAAGADLELVTFKSSPMYTSLKDLLPPSPSFLSPKLASPAAVNSTASGGGSSISGFEICIRNRLVKQAAWAYLQPMSSPPSAASRSCLWSVFSGEFIGAFIAAVKRSAVRLVARASNCLARPLWLIFCR